LKIEDLWYRFVLSFLFKSIELLVSVHGFKGSGVQARPGTTICGYEIAFTFYGLGFPSPHPDMPGLGQGLHSRSRTAFGMHIYEKSVSFVRANPKFGAKLAIIWETEHF
jgi:hypothetical protein